MCLHFDLSKCLFQHLRRVDHDLFDLSNSFLRGSCLYEVVPLYEWAWDYPLPRENDHGFGTSGSVPLILIIYDQVIIRVTSSILQRRFSYSDWRSMNIPKTASNDNPTSFNNNSTSVHSLFSALLPKWNAALPLSITAHRESLLKFFPSASQLWPFSTAAMDRHLEMWHLLTRPTGVSQQVLGQRACIESSPGMIRNQSICVNKCSWTHHRETSS